MFLDLVHCIFIDLQNSVFMIFYIIVMKNAFFIKHFPHSTAISSFLIAIHNYFIVSDYAAITFISIIHLLDSIGFEG